MQNPKSLYTVVFCLLTAAFATADSRGLDVRPAGKEAFQITPREIVSTTFRITNTSGQRYLFVSEVDLPEGWGLITEDFPFELQANESVIKMVSFIVPENTKADRYPVTYRVQGKRYPAIRDQYTIHVNVLGGPRAKERPDGLPVIVAGGMYEVPFSVFNKTKTENTIHISAQSSENFPFTVDTPSFKLGPNQSRIVTVTVETNAALTKKLLHRLEVTAQIDEDGKPGTRSSSVHVMEVLPRPKRTVEQADDAVSTEAGIQQSEVVPPVPRLKKAVEDRHRMGPESSDSGLLSRAADATELIETDPRKIVTMVFRVTNPTDTKRNFVPEVTLPDGWTPITRARPFELSPNQTDSKFLSVLVPQTALAGTYEITYAVQDAKEASLRDSMRFKIRVLPVSKLHTSLLESPAYIIAGEEYQSSFVVTNQSNSAATIHTKIQSGDDIPWTANADRFTLGPAESKTVVVTAKTDEAMTKELKHLLRFTAEVVQEGQVEVHSKEVSIVNIIPRISGAEDRFHRIPTELSLSYVSQQNGEDTSGIQTEVRGKGTLDEEGTKHVEYLFRGPDVEDKSIYGERDEYTLSYWTKDYALHLGDRYYSLSDLTESYLYGRGLEGTVRMNDKLSLGAYYTKSRWLNPKIEETAVYVDYALDEKNNVGANYLGKLQGGDRDNITSVEAQLEPFKNTWVDLEYALGPNQTSNGNAYLADINGYQDRLYYYLKLIHAGPDYPGYYRDLDYLSGGIEVPVNKNLNFNASYRREEKNLDKDPAFFAAPLEEYYRLGLDYKPQTNTTLSIDWISRDRRDRFDTASFDYLEETMRLGIGQAFDKVSFQGSVELGDVDNELDGSTSDSEKYSASVYYRPDGRQSYSGYVNYDTNSDFTGNNRRGTTFGLSARYQLARRTQINLAVQTNDYQGAGSEGEDNAELGVSHTFPNNNRLSVSARHTAYRDSDREDDTALMVRYTIPFGLPASRKKSIGSIAGNIYDHETGDAMGEVILRLNDQTAVTDQTGHFKFPSVTPGIWYLTVDTASIGMNRVPTLKTPIKVDVRGGERTPLDIEVTRAASLAGRIDVYGYEKSGQQTSSVKKTGETTDPYYISQDGIIQGEQGTLTESGGMANLILELRNDSEVRRILTDSQGYFEFEQLRPGKWTLKIKSVNLPEHLQVEKDTFEVELEPGQKSEIAAKVLPRKRRIRIIGTPKILTEEDQS